MTLESENAAAGCAGSPYMVKPPPQHNSSAVFLKRNLPPFNPENVSLRYEPFTDTTLAMESAPDAVGVGGGAWLPQTAPVEAHLRPPSPRTRESQLPKRLLIACRDKESLLEEIITLKSELNCQGRKYQAQKIYSSSIQIENRKLEMDIEELEEIQGAEAPRTGGSEKMRTKLHAMKNRLENLHLICEEQREELMNLRKDLRLTRTRELEIERDVFADEVIRLLKIMKRLKALQNKLTCENKELSVIRDRAVLLEIANKRLENCVLAIQKTLEKTQAETAAFKQKALTGKQEEKRCKELEDQAAKLSAQLDAETAEKEKWLKKAKALENELRKLTKDLRECEAARAACTNGAAGGAPGAAGKGGAGAPDAKKVQNVGLSPRTDTPGSKASIKAREEAKLVSQPVTPRQKVKAVASPQVSPTKQEMKPVVTPVKQELKPVVTPVKQGVKPVVTPRQEVKPVTPRQAPSKQEPTRVVEPSNKAVTKVSVAKDKAKVPRLSFVQVQQGAGEGMGAPRSSVIEAAMYAAQKEKAEKEAARKAQLEEERRKKAEALEAFKRQQEEELKQKQDEDARRREEARRRKREEEARKKAEDEARLAKLREEEERKKREEEERRGAEEERRTEEEARRRREEENARQQEEEESRRKEEDERMQREEEERRQRAGEDSKRQEEEDIRRKGEEEQRRRREEEERRRREEEERRRKEQEERKRREEEERRRRDEEEKKRRIEEERKERERREAEQRKQKEEEERRKLEAEEQARKQREEEERKKTGGRKSAYEDHMKTGDPDAQAKLEKKMRPEGRSGSFVSRRLAKAKEDGFAEDTKQIVENRGNAFLQHRSERASVGFALHSTAASQPAGAAPTLAQKTYSRKNLTAPDSVWQ